LELALPNLIIAIFLYRGSEVLLKDKILFIRVTPFLPKLMPFKPLWE
jgi:hypothetical protein